MNEDQAERMISVMSDISRKLDVVIPQSSYQLKTIKYNEMFKEKVRHELFALLDDKQKKELFAIEKQIREALG